MANRRAVVIWSACWLCACGSSGHSDPALGGLPPAFASTSQGGAGPGGTGGTAPSAASNNPGQSNTSGNGDMLPPSAVGNGGEGGAVGNGGEGGAVANEGGGGSTVAPVGEPGVYFVGRMDRSDPAGPRFAWSGSGAIVAFNGTSLSVTLNDSGRNQFSVVVDGVLAPKLVAQAGARSYEVATGLAAGEHRVEIYRRTEASFGPTQWLGVELGGGQLLGVAPPARRIELIGDSISAGYGDEGKLPCPFTPDTENHYLTYGALSARALGAELITLAWSGKGIVYNYDTDMIDPMPLLYGRTLPQDAASRWDFSLIPDAVVINLGTNDYSTAGDPTPELFQARYLALLNDIRQHYPQAFISCTVGNLLSGADLLAARAAISAAVASFQAAGGSRIAAWEMNVANTDPGCDYHPSLAAHQAMANALTPQLKAALGW